MIVLEIRKEKHYRTRNLEGLLDRMRCARFLQRNNKLEIDRVGGRRERFLSRWISQATSMLSVLEKEMATQSNILA